MLEDAYTHIVEGVKQYDLIVVDSITALSFRAELENEPGSGNMGIKAKLLNQLCRVLPVLLTKHNCTVIFINQERDSFDGYGKVIPGGKGQLYASSHTIRLSTDAKSRFQKDGEIAGHWVTAELRKSRVSIPFRKTKFKLVYL